MAGGGGLGGGVGCVGVGSGMGVRVKVEVVVCETWKFSTCAILRISTSTSFPVIPETSLSIFSACLDVCRSVRLAAIQLSNLSVCCLYQCLRFVYSTEMVIVL